MYVCLVGGFLLNNELTDFSRAPERNGRLVANRVEGGKRPRSSMSPLIVFDRSSGRPRFVLGSPGGSSIIAYVARTAVASGLLDKMGLNDITPDKGPNSRAPPVPKKKS